MSSRVLCLATGVHLALLLAPVCLLSGFARITDPAILSVIGLLLAFGAVEGAIPRSLGSALPGPTEGPAWLPSVVGLVLLLVIWIGLAERVLVAAPVSAWLVAIGAVSMIVGIALRGWSIRFLGPWFHNEIRLVPTQPLQTRGIYGFLRHPSEAGTLAIAVGAAVILASPAALAIVAGGLIPLVCWRIRLEDDLLERAYGDEFRAYARSVGGLLPRISLSVCPIRSLTSDESALWSPTTTSHEIDVRKRNQKGA